MFERIIGISFILLYFGGVIALVDRYDFLAGFQSRNPIKLLTKYNNYLIGQNIKCILGLSGKNCEERSRFRGGNVWV